MMPKGWVSKPLGEVISYKKGFAFKSENFRDSGRRIIRISDTTSSSIKNDTSVYVEEHESLEKYELLPNDIILTTVGSRPPLYDSMVGKAIKIPSYIDRAYLNQNLVKLVPNNEIDSDFLYLKLKEPRFVSYISTLVRGNANQVSITLDELFDYQLLLPSKQEQEKIAKIFSTWDEAIGKTELLIYKKNHLKQSLMNELLTGKKRFPEFEESTSMGEGVPSGWKQSLIKGVTKTILAGATPSTSKPEYWDGGTIRWMKSGEINLKKIYEVENRITELGLKDSSTKLLPVDSILIALAGQGKTRGTVAINKVELCTNQSLAALIPNDAIHPEYLFYNLDSRYEELRKESGGEGGRGGLNLEIIKKLSILFPGDLMEQEKIASTLALADLEIEFFKKTLAGLKAQKQGLMQKLLTGKKRVKV